VILRVLRAFDRLRQAARRRSWKAGHALGRQGEDYAHRLLQEQGYVVVARNYRLPDGRGEIDLVAWEGDTLVFVEVKSRQSDEFGLPERAIGTDKRLHLARAARRYARKAGSRGSVSASMSSASSLIVRQEQSCSAMPSVYECKYRRIRVLPNTERGI